MNFKGIVEEDISSVFLNDEEFSEKHKIDGVEMNVIIDGNEIIERQGNNHDGTYLGKTLIYVSSSEFGNKPKINSALRLDHKLYTVKDCIDENGIYSITLERTKG